MAKPRSSKGPVVAPRAAKVAPPPCVVVRGVDGLCGSCNRVRPNIHLPGGKRAYCEQCCPCYGREMDIEREMDIGERSEPKSGPGSDRTEGG